MCHKSRATVVAPEPRGIWPKPEVIIRTPLAMGASLYQLVYFLWCIADTAKLNDTLNMYNDGIFSKLGVDSFSNDYLSIQRYNLLNLLDYAFQL